MLRTVHFSISQEGAAKFRYKIQYDDQDGTITPILTFIKLRALKDASAAYADRGRIAPSEASE
jgi:hypothetical protein